MMGRPKSRSQVIAAAILLLAAAPACADEAKKMPEAAKRDVLDRLAHDPAVARTYALCPADAFDRQASWLDVWRMPRSTPAAICTADPLFCLASCLDTHDAGACLGLARALQIEDGNTTPPAKQLFSVGCGAGSGPACTNRASIIRNYLQKDDPLHGTNDQLKQACEFRSFRIACRQGDAWGCSMLGQSYQNGEGVAKDAADARSYFEKSCSINPDFPACDFARRHLQALDGKAP